MPFKDLLADTVSVLKKSGQRVDNIQAAVNSTKIFIDRSDVLIEPLDLVHRKMSNGATETFEVVDPGFHEAFHGIPAGYQMKVRKLGVPEAQRAIQSITYNVSGPNARINNHSVDKSLNYAVNENAEVLKHVLALRAELNEVSLKEVERQSAREIVDEIEEGVRSGKTKKTVIGALLAALPNMGNIASIGSLLLDCLSK